MTEGKENPKQGWKKCREGRAWWNHSDLESDRPGFI